METRWMLYMEEGQTLKLLAGVPRNWLENGKEIEVSNVASYFGPLSFRVTSNIDKGYIEATIECKSERMPQQVILRIPHPAGNKPVRITGGSYNEADETSHYCTFQGTALRLNADLKVGNYLILDFSH